MNENERQQVRGVCLHMFALSLYMISIARHSLEQWCVVFTMQDEIWRFAKSFPMSSELMEPSDYVLCCVTSGGENEELIEEGKQLADIDYFM